MKLFLLFNFLFLLVLNGWTQGGIEHVKIGKDTTKEASYFPHIGKYYEGEIPFSDLGDISGLQVSEGWTVISFSISYPSGNQNKILSVKGNRIPEFIIKEIFSNSMGEMIFITNIAAYNEKNEKVYLTPMSLTPVN